MSAPGRGRGVDLVELVTGVALAVAGVAIFVLTLDFRPAPSVGRDPAILPRAVGVVLAACGVGIGLGGLRGRRRQDSTEAPALATIAAGQDQLAATAEVEEGPPAAAPVAAAPVAATLAGVAVYAWLAFSVGYLVATLLFLAVTPPLLAGRRDRRTLATTALLAVGLTTLSYAGLVEFLRVPLPPTPLP